MARAASSVRLSASGVEISGLGAPLRTATPTLERARVASEPRASLPALSKPSMALRGASTKSAASPSCIRFTMATPSPNAMLTLWPLAISNCGTNSSTTLCSAIVESPLISAALA